MPETRINSSYLSPCVQKVGSISSSLYSSSYVVPWCCTSRCASIFAMVQMRTLEESVGSPLTIYLRLFTFAGSANMDSKASIPLDTPFPTIAGGVFI